MPKINREEYEVLKELDEKWKWIARDKDRGLYALIEEPVRKDGHPSYWGWFVEPKEGPYASLELFDEKHLFQFIQWEDEDPYNVAELIEEYEFGKILLAMAEEETVLELECESVETEVKKDIEWLTERVLTKIKSAELNVKAHEGVLADDFESRAIAYKKVLKDINQLDEPEVTREQVVEWIGNNEFYCHATAETVLENAVDKGELGYYGTKYSVVKKEPETVDDVISDFWKSFERLKEVMSMEVEELEG